MKLAKQTQVELEIIRETTASIKSNLFTIQRLQKENVRLAKRFRHMMNFTMKKGSSGKNSFSTWKVVALFQFLLHLLILTFYFFRRF